MEKKKSNADHSGKMQRALHLMHSVVKKLDIRVLEHVCIRGIH